MCHWLDELWLFKARQVHRIRADGRVFMEPWGCLTCLYSRVGDPHTLQAVCPRMALQVSPCHLSLPGSCVLSQWEAPNSLIYYIQIRLARCQQILCNRASYYSCGPTQGYGNILLDPVSKLWEHCFSGPFTRLWETASLSCPDILVRQADCLHLPYTRDGVMSKYHACPCGSHNLSQCVNKRRACQRWGFLGSPLRAQFGWSSVGLLDSAFLINTPNTWDS